MEIICWGILGNRLIEVSGDDNCVTRFGGDEFEILISSVSRISDIEEVSKNVLKSFTKTLPLQ